MTKVKAADYIVELLVQHGVGVVFGYQGGMVTHLADSISKHPQMKFVQVYHEQTAAFAAVGYARKSGRIGVAIATSGPGATNLITGIADAFFDSVPVIFITGQVNAYEYKYDKKQILWICSSQSRNMPPFWIKLKICRPNLLKQLKLQLQDVKALWSSIYR